MSRGAERRRPPRGHPQARRRPATGPWRRGLVGFLVTLAVIAAPAHAQVISLSLASRPVQSGVISTAQNDERSFRVLSGGTLRFSRARGRDSRLVAAGGFSWTQVEDVPRDAESLELTPVLTDDGQVNVRAVVTRKEGDVEQTLDTRVLVTPGDWAPLYEPAGASTPGRRVYGSAPLGDSLYLRVTLPP